MAEKRPVLVAVLGNTPAILTESFYYYARMRNPPIIFQEIHVFTTSLGKDQATSKLLGNGTGKDWFYRLLRHLRIPTRKVAFGERDIHVLKSPDGKELVDVRNARDSMCIADQLCEQMRKLCSDDDTAVYATIAGGRKTMGLYLAFALQLFGRPQDRLFHILVDPRIEKPNLEFFFPYRPIRLDGKTLQPKDIRIDCDELPVLSWPWELEHVPKSLSYSELHRLRQRQLQWMSDPPALTIDTKSKAVRIGDISVKLKDKEFLYYSFFADLRRSTGIGSLSLRHFSSFLDKALSNDANLQREALASPVLPAAQRLKAIFAQVYKRLRGETTFNLRVAADFQLRPDGFTFALSSTLSHIKKKLELAVGPALARRYIIDRVGVSETGAEASSIYGIRLEPEKIYILNLA